MTPECKRFNEWSNLYKIWMFGEFDIRSKEERILWEEGFKVFKRTLPEALKPLAIALEKTGYDSTDAWKAIGNPLAADIESTLEKVWVLARRYDAKFASVEQSPASEKQVDAPDVVAVVRAIVNKVQKMKISQPKKGAEIARQVDDATWEAFAKARRISKTKIDYFATLIRDCSNHERGIPKWLKG